MLAASGGLGPSAAGGGFGLDMSLASGGNVPALGVQGQTSFGLFAPVAHSCFHLCPLNAHVQKYVLTPLRMHAHALTNTITCMHKETYANLLLHIHACIRILKARI